jgi:integrase/recombinase XerC
MDHILSFLKYIEFEKRYSKCTIESYKTDLEQFFEFCKSGDTVAELTEVEFNLIRQWIVHLIDKGVENRSINRKLSSLKSFYKYMQRQQWITKNPLIGIESLKVKKRLPVFVPETKMDNLVHEVLWNVENNPIRDKLILELFYCTGIRLSELINLKEKDIDLTNLSIKVIGKRNKERIIPISRELSHSINEYLNFKSSQGIKSEQPYLFITEKGEKLYPKFVYRIVHEYLSIITTQEKRSPHVLRHTFATHMLNNGAGINEIKELLGHANLAATQVYTHNSFEKLKKIYKQAHPRA